MSNNRQGHNYGSINDDDYNDYVDDNTDDYFKCIHKVYIILKIFNK